jgi:hypothetical protein
MPELAAEKVAPARKAKRQVVFFAEPERVEKEQRPLMP